MMKSEIKYTRFNLTDSDRKRIQINRDCIDHVYLKYSVRNIGAGSAVDMVVKVNGRELCSDAFSLLEKYGYVDIWRNTWILILKSQR